MSDWAALLAVGVVFGGGWAAFTLAVVLLQ